MDVILDGGLSSIWWWSKMVLDWLAVSKLEQTWKFEDQTLDFGLNSIKHFFFKNRYPYDAIIGDESSVESGLSGEPDEPKRLFCDRPLQEFSH